MKRLFISGTDTGVGKTLVSALLCKSLLEDGHKVAYYKPVQTGSEELGGELISIDTEFVKSICSEDLRIIPSLMFKLPASPHLAAECEDEVIDIDQILQTAAAVQGVDFLVIEGAGGLAVPITAECDMAQLCAKLKAELLVVARPNLGTLNHTFLTINYAESYSLKPLVVISGASAEPDIIERDNIKMITQKSGGRLIACVPQVEALDTEDFSGISVPQVKFNL
ncbi:MAG: dethiobiotin synthase [Lentisphaeraceae bacterium]|nr:dethiobiotin synthase [Lentisphaeraceae bacterium]